MPKQILRVTFTVLGVLAAFLFGAAFMTFMQFGGMVFGPAFVSGDDLQPHWEPTIYRDYARYEEAILTSLLANVDHREFDAPDELQNEILRLSDVAEAAVNERMASDRPSPIAGVLAPSIVTGEAGPEQDP